MEGLGTFVEIEVPFARDAGRARRSMAALAACLGVTPRDILSCSYADLLAAREKRQARARRPATTAGRRGKVYR